MVDPEPEPLVEPPSGGICAHDVQERGLAAAALQGHEPLHQRARHAPALEVRVRAHAADLAEVANMHALAGHGNEAFTLEVAVILSQFDGAQPERTGAGELRELQGLLRVPRPKPLRAFGSAARSSD